MRFVRVADLSAAREALRLLSDGRAVSAMAFDNVAAQIGRLRDQVLSREPQWAPTVPASLPLFYPDAALVGWTYGVMQSGEWTPSHREAREAAAAALGYVLRSMRKDRRITQSDPSLMVGVDYPREMALVGEPALALVTTRGTPADAGVELAPGVARAAQDAIQYTLDVLRAIEGDGAVTVSTASRTAMWMAREYAVSSQRAEWLTYAALAGGVGAALWVLGVFRGPKAPPDASKAEGRGKMPLPTNPYGDPRSYFDTSSSPWG